MSSKVVKKKRDWLLSLLLLAAWLPAGCGKTSSEDSGETHFLSYCSDRCDAGYECLCGVCTRSCEVPSSCSAEAAGASCVTPAAGACAGSSICDVTCVTAEDCSALGSDYRCEAGLCRAGVRPEPDGGGSCPAGCFPVTGYPEDAARACVDLERGAQVACQCGAPASGSVCQRRASDGSLWMLPNGEAATAGEWQRCDDAESERLRGSCAFAGCAEPPSSFCSVEDSCAARNCGGLQFDAQGCAKPSCSEDADCAAGERCVATSVDISNCSYSAEGVCNCASLTIDVRGAFCNSVSEVGPGGSWRRLDVEQGAGPCPEQEICQWTWSVTPDGAVATMKQGVSATAQLDPSDLADLDQLIDGPELRRGMRDGFSCDPPPSDVGVSMTLVLPEQTLAQNVTGCTTTGPEGNVAGRVFTLLQKY